MDDSFHQQATPLPGEIQTHRPQICTFNSFVQHFQKRMFSNKSDRQVMQPHFNEMRNVRISKGNLGNPAEAICSHHLRKAHIKPNRQRMNVACWSTDGRRLACGDDKGFVTLWNNETFNFFKAVGVHQSENPDYMNPDPEFQGNVEDKIVCVPIRAMAWSKYSDFVLSGDNDGNIKILTSSLTNFTTLSGAHAGPVQGLSFSPTDPKYVSCSDDNTVQIWSLEQDFPEKIYSGERAHLSEVKCARWHPYRSLIASGGHDNMIKLWDPRQAEAITTINSHKKYVLSCSWSNNGNWLASGSADHSVKVFDIRAMKEFATFRGHESKALVTEWHPEHDSLLISGGSTGSLIYWVVGESDKPHTIIPSAHRGPILFAEWHPTGHVLATSGLDGNIRFWTKEPPGSKLEQKSTGYFDNFVAIISIY